MFLTCDAACNPNPGPCAIGVALFSDAGEVVETISRAIGDGTNNTAEYEAALAAFTLARDRKIAQPDVRTDSLLVVNQSNGVWGVNEETLLPFNARMRRALAATGGTISWIPREENTIADALSKRPLRPSIFIGDTAAVVAQIERSIVNLTGVKDAEILKLSRFAIEAIGAHPEDVSDALAALRVGRGPTSTMTSETARFNARLLHGEDAVALLEAAITERSPATRLKALRWAARGIAPALVAGKLQIEKALTAPYRLNRTGGDGGG